MRSRPHPSLGLLVVSVLAATLAFTAFAGAAGRPQPTGGFLDPHDPVYDGPSYLSLTVTGEATAVRVRFKGAAAFGRLAPHSSNTIRKGKVWDFGAIKRDRTAAMKRMLRKVFHEYDRVGIVRPKVRVYGGRDSITEWRCALTQRTARSTCHEVDQSYSPG